MLKPVLLLHSAPMLYCRKYTKLVLSWITDMLKTEKAGLDIALDSKIEKKKKTKTNVSQNGYLCSF